MSSDNRPVMELPESERDVYVLNIPNFTKSTSINILLVLVLSLFIIGTTIFSVYTYTRLQGVKIYKQDVMLSNSKEISQLQRDYFDALVRIEIMDARDKKFREDFITESKKPITTKSKKPITTKPKKIR